MGTIKGVGRIYKHTVIDTYTKIGFAKLCNCKNSLTAADILNDRVIPWFEEQSADILRVLTDRGTEYCGKIEIHIRCQKYAVCQIKSSLGQFVLVSCALTL